MIGRSRDRQAGIGSQVLADAGGELGMRVEPGAGRGSTERDLAETRHRVAHASASLSHLGRIPSELLSERHRNGVHQMRAARLHDVVELGGLALERSGKELERGQQLARQLRKRRQVHGGREDVVGRLAHVHVIVRMDVITRERRDHLVRVHVRARARAGLEHVDRELIVELASCDPVACRRDALSDVRIKQSKVGVHASCRSLDPPEPTCNGGGDGLAGNGEVRYRLLRLCAPESLRLGRFRHDSESSSGASDCLR